MSSGESIGTTRQGPEECFTYECDVCKLDGAIKEANIYCPQCEEYLCDDCEAVHKKPKASRFHQVRPVADLPGPVKETSKPAIKYFCSCNQKGVISYYCSDHKDILCLTCKNVTHRKCNMLTIDEIANQTLAIHDYNQTADKANGLLEKATKLKNERKKSFDELKEKETQCREDIQKTKYKINQLLNQLEENALAEVKDKVQMQSDVLGKVQGTIESTIQLLNADKMQFDATKSSKEKCQQFVASTKLLKSMEDCDSVLDEISSKMIFSDVAFEPNRKLKSLEEDLDSLGQIKVSISKYCAVPREVFLETQVSEVKKVNTRNDTDKKSILISGVTFLENGELLICDYNNAKLMLLDTAFKISETIGCSSAPWDIAVLNDKKVVVTNPVAKKLQYFTITPNLETSRSIVLSTSAWCWGVAVANGFMFVSCHYEGTPEVLVLDIDGNMLKSINETSSGIKLQKPYYIASNRAGNKLYISDYDSNKVICMSVEEKSIFIYSDSEMKYPRGLVVDDDDNVLVCCEGTNNIHVIKSDGSKYKMLLSSQDGIEKPHGMEYRSSYGTLVVGSKDIDDILIFTKK